MTGSTVVLYTFFHSEEKQLDSALWLPQPLLSKYSYLIGMFRLLTNHVFSLPFTYYRTSFKKCKIHFCLPEPNPLSSTQVVVSSILRHCLTEPARAELALRVLFSDVLALRLTGRCCKMCGCSFIVHECTSKHRDLEEKWTHCSRLCSRALLEFACAKSKEETLCVRQQNWPEEKHILRWGFIFLKIALQLNKA